jgi:hypothetical protein
MTTANHVIIIIIIITIIIIIIIIIISSSSSSSSSTSRSIWFFILCCLRNIFPTFRHIFQLPIRRSAYRTYKHSKRSEWHLLAVSCQVSTVVAIRLYNTRVYSKNWYKASSGSSQQIPCWVNLGYITGESGCGGCYRKIDMRMVQSPVAPGTPL